MDVDKTTGKNHGTANRDGELVLQWGTSKRLRGGKKETRITNYAPGVLKKAVKTDREVSQTGKQAYRPRKQLHTDRKSSPSHTVLRHSQARKTVKRYDSGVSSALESQNISKHKLSRLSKSSAKSKVDKNPFSNKIINSTAKNKEMVVARRGLEGLHIGTFNDELQDLEVYLMPNFMIALTHKEKEEDFMAMKGSKLPIRPKKRAKHVQKALHCVSPGSWLCELSLDRYEVREKISIKKKSWGLKAMIIGDSISSKS